MDRDSGRSRGFGFVSFEDKKALQEAIDAMNGMDLDERNITVDRAQPGGDGGRDCGGVRDHERGRSDYGGGHGGCGGGECFKCRKPGHFARECPCGNGGSRGGGGKYGGRNCVYICAEKGSSVSNLRRQWQARITSSAHRGSPARASKPGRLTRSNGLFPGQPVGLALPSRERASIFPADMEIETRIRLLGEMEAFNIMGMGPAFLQKRDNLNESDFARTAVATLKESKINQGCSGGTSKACSEN